MANRFWRGGSGTWNATSTTNWSATSGGAGGASAPTAVDDVFFDANSGTPTVTTGVGATCRSWTHSGLVAATFNTETNGVTVHGAISWIALTAVSGNVNITFAATSGSWTINLASKVLGVTNGVGGRLRFTDPASTATWTLSGTFNFGTGTTASLLEVAGGTLNTGNVAVQNALNLRVLNTASAVFGTSVLTVGNIEVQETASLSAASSTLNVVHNNSETTRANVLHGGKTYGTVVITGTNCILVGVVTRQMSVGAFTRTGAGNTYNQMRLQNTDLVCSGTLTLSSGGGANRLFVFADQDGVPATISAATRVLTDVDFRYITAAGGIVPWVLGPSVGNCQGNTNLSFAAPRTLYAVNSGTWNSSSVWSLTSGGAGGAGIPLAQDDVQFTSGSGAITVTSNTARVLCRNLYVANFTGTLSFNRQVATAGAARLAEIYGDVEIAPGSNVTATAGTFLITRKVGTSTFQNMSAGASFPIICGNTTRLSLTTTAGTLQGVVLYAGEMVLSAGGSVSSISSTLTTGTEDDYNLSARASSSSPSLDLSDSNFSCASISTPATITGGTSTISLNSAGTSTHSWEGSVNNLTLVNTTAGEPVLTFSTFSTNGVAGELSTASSTQFFSAVGKITFTGNAGTRDVGTRSSFFMFGTLAGGTMELVANGSRDLETQYAYFINTTLSGAGRLVAFGAADLGQNTGITFANDVILAGFTTYNGAYTLPEDFSGTYYVVAHGGGGQGAGEQISTGTGGGGGGAYALSAGLAPLSPGQTVWVRSINFTSTGASIFNPGATPLSSYLNIASNAAPTTPAQGVLAASGQGAPVTGAGGAGGLASASVGHLKADGGSGGSSGGLYSGGGGGGSPGSVFGPGFSGGDSPATTKPFPMSGGGGAGLQSAGAAGTSSRGGNGGGPNGGTGANASFSSSPLTGGTAASPVGSFAAVGGGGGGGARSTLSTTNNSFVPGTGDNTIRISIVNHSMTVGSTIKLDSVTASTGSWSQSGTTQVNCIFASHGLTTGTGVFLTFSGTNPPPAQIYVVTVVNTSSFRVTASSASTGNGSFRFGVDPALTEYQVTAVVNTGVIQVQLSGGNSNSPRVGVCNVTRFPPPGSAAAGNGGPSISSRVYPLSYENGGIRFYGKVLLGPSGGGGGGGSSPSNTAGTGARGPIAAGGGGGGGRGDGGSGRAGGGGGSGLVVLVYSATIPTVTIQIT